MNQHASDIKYKGIRKILIISFYLVLTEVYINSATDRDKLIRQNFIRVYWITLGISNICKVTMISS